MAASASDERSQRSPPSVHQVLGVLVQTGAALELRTTDLCFLVALRERAGREGLASFEEEVLLDVYEQVCDLAEPGAELPRKRATHAIQRLRDQGLLVRVDGAGIVRAGEFALTRLSLGIADHYLAREVLTRESLAILTKTLASNLVEILAAARLARSAQDWSRSVIQPLQVTVLDLLTGIDRRQLGLDAQQGEVRRRISELLQSDWFRAVDACDGLLEETARTLQELKDVLLQDGTALLSHLEEIAGLANQADATGAVRAAQQAQEQVDRVMAWGAARHRAWSDYYQYVQRYLRDVVRLDPDRAVSQRLKDQLAGWHDASFALNVAAAPSIRLLRPPDTTVARPPVTRPREAWTQELTTVEAGTGPLDGLEARIRAALAAGDRTLVELARTILPELPEADRYKAMGRIAALAAAQARVRHPLVPAWEEVDALQVEDWELQLAKARRR